MVRPEKVTRSKKEKTRITIVKLFALNAKAINAEIQATLKHAPA